MAQAAGLQGPVGVTELVDRLEVVGPAGQGDRALDALQLNVLRGGTGGIRGRDLHLLTTQVMEDNSWPWRGSTMRSLSESHQAQPHRRSLNPPSLSRAHNLAFGNAVNILEEDSMTDPDSTDFFPGGVSQ